MSIISGQFLDLSIGSEAYSELLPIFRAGTGSATERAHRGLPYSDRSVKGIYCCNFVEYLTQTELLIFMRECRRALIPGGVIRVVTPDLRSIVGRYIADDWRSSGVIDGAESECTKSGAEFLNLSMRGGGRSWVCDQDEMARLGALAGLIVAEGKLDESLPILSHCKTTAQELTIDFQKRIDPFVMDPLVSIVVPAYRPEFLVQCLESALAQTHSNIEIIVSDDCRTSDVERIVRGYERIGAPVTYIRNPLAAGEGPNLTNAIRVARGEFIKPLNDDDLLSPDCVQKLLQALQSTPDARLACGQRIPIDVEGRLMDEALLGAPLSSQSTCLPGTSVIAEIADTGTNLVGEPTVMLFRRSDALAIPETQVTAVCGRRVYGIGDVGLAVNLLGGGDLAYLAETVASFRLHDGQSQRDAGMRKRCLDSWVYLRTQTERLGLSGRVPRRVDGWIQDRDHSKALELASNTAPSPFRPGDQMLAGSERTWIVASVAAAGDLTGIGFAVLIDGRTDPSRIEPTLHSLQNQIVPPIHIAVLHSGSIELADLGRVSALTDSDLGPWLAGLGEEPDLWLHCLAAGDVLSEDALYQAQRCIVSNPAAVVAYFDHDEITDDGLCRNPHFKPDANPDLLRSYAYVGRSVYVRLRWMESRGLELPLDLRSAYDLALQALEASGEGALAHIPTVIAHLDARVPTVWPRTAGESRDLAAVLEEHLARVMPGTSVLDGPALGTFHVVPPLERTPLVSIIIPTKDQLPLLRRCIDTLLKKTTYPNYEVIVVDNGSETPEARRYLKELPTLFPDRIRVLAHPGAFNFSAMNNRAAAAASGEFLLLLNNDTAIIQDGWLTQLVRNGLREEVGIVGPALFFPNGQIQHAGVLLGLRGPAEHPFIGLPADAPGYLFRAQVQQNYSAVTGACLLVRKELYRQLGGLDETDFAVSYNDIDFCLRVRSHGKQVVWTPLAMLLHEGNASQQSGTESLALERKAARFSRERTAMYARWADWIGNDPAYNPNLALTGEAFAFEPDSFLRFDRAGHDLVPRVMACLTSGASPVTRGIAAALGWLEQMRICQAQVLDRLPDPNLVLRSGARILVLQPPQDGEQFTRMEDLVALPGIVKILDGDGLLQDHFLGDLPSDGRRSEWGARIERLVSHCDRVLVTDPESVRRLQPYCSDVRIATDAMEPPQWADPLDIVAVANGIRGNAITSPIAEQTEMAGGQATAPAVSPQREPSEAIPLSDADRAVILAELRQVRRQLMTLCLSAASTNQPGPSAARKQTASRSAEAGEADSRQGQYTRWLSMRQKTIDAFEPPIDDALAQAGPTFHLVLRQGDDQLARLADTLDNLAHQRYGNWFLDIVTSLPAPDGIEDLPCIGWHQVADDQHKQAIDELVATRSLDWIIEIPPGAVLDPWCLWRVAIEGLRQPDAMVFFVDDDIYDEAGNRRQPRFKPGVNPAWLSSSDLAGPLFVRRDAWLGCVGAAIRNGSPWFDQLLRLTRQQDWTSIRHIADVLISYPGAAPGEMRSCLASLLESLPSQGSRHEVLRVSDRSWYVRPPLDEAPPVTIAVLSQGQTDLLERCLRSIVERTRYARYELLTVLTDRGYDPDLKEWLANSATRFGRDIKVVTTDPEANQATRCNAAVAACDTGQIVFFREECIVIQAQWLDELLRASLDESVAAVAPRLIHPQDKTIFEVGRVLGLDGLVGAPYRNDAGLNDAGMLDQLQVVHDASVLSATCMLIRTTDYNGIGGMDAAALDDTLSDADLCLRLQAHRRRLLVQPFASVVFRGDSTLSIPGDAEAEARQLLAYTRSRRTFAEQWLTPGARDPFWNPNLSLAHTQPTEETTGQVQWHFQPATTEPCILARPIPNAQGHYRIETPLRYASEAGLASSGIWPQTDEDRELSVADLSRLAPTALVVQNYISHPRLESLQTWHAHPHRPFLVYALDDLLTDLDESNPVRKHLAANARACLRHALAHCDRLVVSTEALAETYKRFIDDIRVIPNRLDDRVWLPLQTQKRTSARPRIGWAGAQGHERDLMLLEPVIEHTRHEADWVFFGMCPDALRPMIAEYHEFGPLADYPERLAALNLDLAVAPLADTPFNHAKSNLRLLEYGVLGIPVVCSDITPYRESPACRASDDPATWTEAVRARIHDAEAREAEGRALRAWVLGEYLLAGHVQAWLNAHLPD